MFKFLSITLATFLLATSANAQTLGQMPLRTEAPNAQTAPLPDNVKPSRVDTIRPQRVEITLGRLPGMTEGQFAILMSASAAMTGCAKFSDLPYEVRFKDIFMDVIVGNYTIDYRRAPNTTHNCGKSYKMPTAEIVVSRDDMVTHNVKKIRFQSVPYINTYEVEMDSDYIKLIPGENLGPDTYQAKTVNTNLNPLLLWFYPDNTVMLYAPQASAADKKIVRQKIDAFAQSRGLEPLNVSLPAFKSPLPVDNMYYYVDKRNVIAQAQGIENGIPFGNIAMEKSIYGLQGDQIVQSALTIYAKKPGTYE